MFRLLNKYHIAPIFLVLGCISVLLSGCVRKTESEPVKVSPHLQAICDSIQFTIVECYTDSFDATGGIKTVDSGIIPLAPVKRPAKITDIYMLIDISGTIAKITTSTTNDQFSYIEVSVREQYTEAAIRVISDLAPGDCLHIIPVGNRNYTLPRNWKNNFEFPPPEFYPYVRYGKYFGVQCSVSVRPSNPMLAESMKKQAINLVRSLGKLGLQNETCLVSKLKSVIEEINSNGENNCSEAIVIIFSDFKDDPTGTNNPTPIDQIELPLLDADIHADVCCVYPEETYMEFVQDDWKSVFRRAGFNNICVRHVIEVEDFEKNVLDEVR